MQELWLITVPNNKESADTTFSTIQNNVSTDGSAKLFRFDIPSLTVGTLDSLMGLSDDLAKINSSVENVVKKVERQYLDIVGPNGDPLRVSETTVEAYLRRFQWDHALFQHQGRQLTEIVSQIQAMTAKIEDDLKLLGVTLSEKVLAEANAVRKKTINLLTSDFEDFLKPEDVARMDPVDSENLLTLAVVIPRSAESDFTKHCDQLGATIAAFGAPDWADSSAVGKNDGRFGATLNRTSVKGSPIVPNSRKKIAEEGENVMYAITILKGHYEAGKIVDDAFEAGTFVDYLEPLKLVFREKRYTIREFSYDTTKTGNIDVTIEAIRQDIKSAKSKGVFWCKAHFGEAYHGWIHLKVIRAFVESVLRYGLPVDFLAFFLEPNLKKEKQLQEQLTKIILRLRPELRTKKTYLQEEDDDDENNDPDHFPYVCQKFTVIGSAASAV